MINYFTQLFSLASQTASGDGLVLKIATLFIARSDQAGSDYELVRRRSVSKKAPISLGFKRDVQREIWSV